MRPMMMTMTPANMGKVILKTKAASRPKKSSEKEIDPWTTLINDAAFKFREQYDHIL